MSSSYAHCAMLNALWLNDFIGFDDSLNVDISQNSKLDFDNNILW
jgi:hypothetical protein